ncbi:3,4-dihydroxy-2-butanone-4-phosphate synthase [Arenibacterium halophilum]|nr:3,4-dihydroxy-2-butanone-4-phosphate synthase [Arenibacterium halophilum]
MNMAAPIETQVDRDFVSFDEIVEEARAGRMFVVVERGRHGREGTLIVPADCADADAVNFFARHARGLVCLSLDETIADRLNLTLMPQTNRSRFGTAFTVSIEARDGISTGISARDRALTIATAIRADAGREDVVSPGHVFPIRVETEELLLRPSAAAAGVEICRAAGRTPAAVICAIMTRDGSIADAAQTREFAAREGFKMVDAGLVARDLHG